MNIIQYWFPNREYQKWWFKSTDTIDKFLYDNFYNDMLSAYNNMNINIECNMLLNDILLLDQVSRNINRIVKDLNIVEYTNKATILSYIWIENKYHLYQPIEHTVFALMPLRHTNNITKYKILFDIIKELENDVTYEDSIILNKFKSTTYYKYNKLLL